MTSNNPDTGTLEATAQNIVLINGSTSIKITKDLIDGCVSPCHDITYMITVTNEGDTQYRGPLYVYDRIPKDTTFSSNLTDSINVGWSHVTDHPEYLVYEILNDQSVINPRQKLSVSVVFCVHRDIKKCIITNIASVNSSNTDPLQNVLDQITHYAPVFNCSPPKSTIIYNSPCVEKLPAKHTPKEITSPAKPNRSIDPNSKYKLCQICRTIKCKHNVSKTT